MNDKDLKKYINFPPAVIQATKAFLEMHGYELYNLALLGEDFRIMHKNPKTGKVEATIFSIPV